MNEHGAAAAVERAMRSDGWDPVVEEAAPGRPDTVAILEAASPGPTQPFVGHTDVVTEGGASPSSYPPLAGDEVDGGLRGRGAADAR